MLEKKERASLRWHGQARARILLLNIEQSRPYREFVAGEASIHAQEYCVLYACRRMSQELTALAETVISSVAFLCYYYGMYLEFIEVADGGKGPISEISRSIAEHICSQQFRDLPIPAEAAG